MVRIKFFLWVTIVEVLSCNVKADTKSTAEGVAIGQVRMGIGNYQLIHDGQIPTNWAQISECSDIAEIERGTFPITKYYAFVRQDKIPLPNAEKGDVFLIRLSPATNIMHPEGGRYIISLAGGSPLLNWLSETNVQKMLVDAGVTELPKPEPLTQVGSSSETLPIRDVNSALPTSAGPAIPKVEPVIVEPAPMPQGETPEQSEVKETQPTSEASSATDSSSFAKKIVLTLAVMLGLVATFVLFRAKKS